ncbi:MULTISPECIES: effector-associated domain EAD1-containing protein [unclassified Paracoccus (in: a-proteobacteria)]|uniref:effector-associated domain EAD1-containing protein n=1 Tax=unclassified Paracoccus (in: a-proteobacteria) TaxID=2688777 RepID=UPI0012B2BC80|nr:MULTISPECIES: effector-associated domain EAD1-containing protein [unclassified Paracoccus (in: a-proteobacteria)]UXU76506.1 effector-associated domain EAD1-containing protein [Paracoccus sp. SMMA_5]UXU82427.1 effector-associated domain EAD1-containing protein [Paracoccus sp. SMMA_5_TC]
MRLSGAECQELLRALIAAFPQAARLDMILTAPPIERALARISAPDTLDVQYHRLVQAANDEGWMDRLCQGLRQADPINPALLALIDRLTGPRTAAAPQPHLELVLDGAPFVNQHPLRHVLQTMTQSFGPKVLQVTGANASGKSYSQTLIGHVARSIGAEVYHIPMVEPTTTARDLVEDMALFMDLGAPPSLADQPQDSTAVMRMVRWLAAMGRKLDRDWWLILDGFDSQRIDDSVTMLMHGLAQSIGNGQPERMRLFLLGWDRPISGPPPGRILEQGLRAFAREDLRDYLDALIGQYAMPADMHSTDDILSLCYQGWDDNSEPYARAQALTQRIQLVALAAIQAAQGGQP